MANIKSPYKEDNFNISENLGTTSRRKVPTFPNQYFRSQEEYFNFTKTYKLYGADANNLKKAMDKKANLIPVLKPPKKG